MLYRVRHIADAKNLRLRQASSLTRGCFIHREDVFHNIGLTLYCFEEEKQSSAK